MNNEQVAKGLGWFSISLGAVQLLAPRWLGTQIGVGNHPLLMRACGLREVATGAGVLRQPNRATGLWARVAGDALDLSLLGLAARRGHMPRIGFATAAVAGVALLDLIYARRLP